MVSKKRLILLVVISSLFLIASSESLVAMDQVKVGMKFYAFAPIDTRNPLESKSFAPYLSFEGQNAGVGVSYSTVKDQYTVHPYEKGDVVLESVATRYEVDGRYYFSTSKPLKPYIGLGFISSTYVHDDWENGQKITKTQEGTAFNPVVGIDAPLQDYGLPYTTLTAGLNYFSPINSTGERYWLHGMTVDEGLTFHLAFKLNFPEILS